MAYTVFGYEIRCYNLKCCGIYKFTWYFSEKHHILSLFLSVLILYLVQGATQTHSKKVNLSQVQVWGTFNSPWCWINILESHTVPRKQEHLDSVCLLSLPLLFVLKGNFAEPGSLSSVETLILQEELKITELDDYLLWSSNSQLTNQLEIPQIGQINLHQAQELHINKQQNLIVALTRGGMTPSASGWNTSSYNPFQGSLLVYFCIYISITTSKMAPE